MNNSLTSLLTGGGPDQGSAPRYGIPMMSGGRSSAPRAGRAGSLLPLGYDDQAQSPQSPRQPGSATMPLFSSAGSDGGARQPLDVAKSIMTGGGSPGAPRANPAAVISRPMAGGTRPEDIALTGQRMIDAGNARAAKPAQPYGKIEASNASLAGMWEQMKGLYGGNNAAARTAFHENASHLGVNGRLWLERNGGDPASQVVVGQNVQQQRIPLSMLGTDHAAGTAAPGLVASERGQTLDGAPLTTPITRTNPALYSKPDPSTLLPGPVTGHGFDVMHPLEPALHVAPPGTVSTPFTQKDAELANQREAQNLRSAGEAAIGYGAANTPVSDRERLGAAVDVGTAAAQVPLEKQDMIDQTQLQRTQQQQQGADQRNARNNDTRKGIADASTQSRITVEQMRQKHAEYLKNMEQRALQSRKGAAGELAPDKFLDNWHKMFNSSASVQVPDEANPGKQRFMNLKEREGWTNGVMQKWQPAPATQPATQPAASGATVNVISPEGTPGTIPAEKLNDALARGFKRAD